MFDWLLATFLLVKASSSVHLVVVVEVVVTVESCSGGGGRSPVLGQLPLVAEPDAHRLVVQTQLPRQLLQPVGKRRGVDRFKKDCRLVGHHL